jgi:hypothetical protein
VNVKMRFRSSVIVYGMPNMTPYLQDRPYGGVEIRLMSLLYD